MSAPARLSFEERQTVLPGVPMPAQRPATSKQDVATPFEFLQAVQERFGRITFDVAASNDNAVTTDGEYFGPGSAYAEDALAVEWPHQEVCWLNPPYGRIKGEGFAKKAALEAARSVPILMLVPAAVSTNWFAAFVHGHALVLPLRPRLTFVGHTDPYPKDLMLCVYNLRAPGFEPWRWK